MTIKLTPIRKVLNCSSDINNVRAKLFYPMLLIFENHENIHLVHVDHKIDKNEPDKFFQFGEKIKDQALKDNFLWLLFQSGEIVVLNLLKGTLKKIINESKVGFKTRQLKNILHHIYFISESGEYFEPATEYGELLGKLEESTNELSLSFKKIHLPCYYSLKTEKPLMNGMDVCINNGAIEAHCPITGVTDTITSINQNMKYVTSWREFAVIVDEIENMWVLNLQESQIVYEFDKTEANYYPVNAHNNIFYYFVWNKKEIQIFSAAESQEILGNSEVQDSNQTLVSQEHLKDQLNILTESILSDSSPVSAPPQLQPLFEEIDDFTYLINTASILCQHNILYKSLIYQLQKRIMSSDNTHLLMVSDLSHKIDLIEYIQFTGNSNYADENLFKYNSRELCITFISKSDFDIASICWLKYSQLDLVTTTDDIVNILNSISSNTKISAILIWLKNFVPSLLEKNPYYVDLFVRWTTERVFKLEQSPYWPKIGLKFLVEIIKILETSLKSICVRPTSIDDLDILKTRIHYIIELKEKFRINILLSELSSQNPSEVVLIMLRRCYTEDLEAFLSDYLPSYVTRHLFDLDETLYAYIESEAASSGGGIDGTRLRILLDSFHSYNNKLECLLQVLKVLDVPWNTTVLDIAIATVTTTLKMFTFSDPERVLAQEIQKELNFANVKVILKKYNFPIGFTSYMLVLQKIVSVTAVDLDDLKIIISVLPAYSNHGNALYIERCLEDCETKVALEHFNSFSSREKKTILKIIISKYDQIINRSSKNMILERNYIDFIKGTQILGETEINNIEALYCLKNSYCLSLNLNSIHNERECKKVVNTWLSNDGNTTSSGRGANVTQLINARYSPITELLRRTSTSHQVRIVVECLLNTSIPSNQESDPMASILSKFNDGENYYLLLNTYNVLIELATNSGEENLHDLLKIISTLNSLINVGVVVKNLSIAWKFHYIYLPISSSSALSDLIYFFKSRKYLDEVETCSHLHIKYDLTSYRMISNTLTNMKCPSMPWLNRIVDITKKIVTKILSTLELDELLLTSLLLILRNFEDIDEQRTNILEVLKANNDILQPNVISYLSLQSMRRTFIFDNEYNKEFGKGSSFPPQYILKSKFNINLEEVAIPENSEETWDVKVILFYVLLQQPNTNFNRLLELCRALNVSINDGLSLQLISLLTTWELKYKVIPDGLGTRKIVCENNDTQLNMCNIIWNSIENKDFLRDILNDFWKNGEITLHGRIISINPYYYEVFLCIYRLMFGSYTENKSTKEYFLINFLKEYKRKSSPKQYEFELFSVKGIFPEIGYFRLPFQLFMREDMWSNLKSEITLDTYERWLPAVALLSLDSDLQTARDMICSNAVKQTMTTKKRDDVDFDSKQTEPWRLTNGEEPLLRAAHRCVRNIANMEWAGACLFYVLQGCARGADQVAAAQLCYQFAQKWAALQPGNRAVRQMERLHATLSTRHALHKIDWACEEFVRLSAEPAQLIRALYLHSDFVEKMSRHDVNRAANEIADKNSINISTIRIQLLENILDKINGDKNPTVLSIKELMTAKYILKATCPKMGAIYLSRIAFDDESDHNKSKKLRALQCLMSVIDQDTSVKVANLEREELWETLRELSSIVNLETIDLPWIAASFTLDRTRALEQLLQATEGNIDGLKVAAQLSAKFGSPQILRNLIPPLLRASLYNEMIPILLKLPSQLDNVVCSAWRAVILTPFQRADYPITERQKNNCLDALNLLPICPIIKDEDLAEVWKHCVRCKCFGLGCLVLPYMTSETRQSLTELSKIDRRNLIVSLKNLHADTYLVSGAMYVIERMASKAYR